MIILFRYSHLTKVIKIRRYLLVVIVNLSVCKLVRARWQNEVVPPSFMSNQSTSPSATNIWIYVGVPGQRIPFCRNSFVTITKWHKTSHKRTILFIKSLPFHSFRHLTSFAGTFNRRSPPQSIYQSFVLPKLAFAQPSIRSNQIVTISELPFRNKQTGMAIN